MLKLAVLSGLVLSASCMVLQPQLPLTYGVQYHDTPNYNFAYEVNDAHTGDIKSQHESRRGETVLGQYTLVQPDGVRRTVDYRADEHAGFQATVNNDRAQQYQNQQYQNQQYQNQQYQNQQYQNQQYSSQYQDQQQTSAQEQSQARSNEAQRPAVPANLAAYIWPAPTPSPTPAPAVAVSRSSIVQTFSHGNGNHNPWA